MADYQFTPSPHTHATRLRHAIEQGHCKARREREISVGRSLAVGMLACGAFLIFVVSPPLFSLGMLACIYACVYRRVCMRCERRRAGERVGDRGNSDEPHLDTSFMELHDAELALVPPIFSRIDVPLKYK
jgi:hypothetical protein